MFYIAATAKGSKVRNYNLSPQPRLYIRWVNVTPIFDKYEQNNP